MGSAAVTLELRADKAEDAADDLAGALEDVDKEAKAAKKSLDKLGKETDALTKDAKQATAQQKKLTRELKKSAGAVKGGTQLFNKMGSALSVAEQGAEGLGGSVAKLIPGVATAAVVAGTATEAMIGFGVATKTVIGFLGPIGVALGIAALAWKKYSDELKTAEEAAKKAAAAATLAGDAAAARDDFEAGIARRIGIAEGTITERDLIREDVEPLFAGAQGQSRAAVATAGSPEQLAALAKQKGISVDEARLELIDLIVGVDNRIEGFVDQELGARAAEEKARADAEAAKKKAAEDKAAAEERAATVRADQAADDAFLERLANFQLSGNLSDIGSVGIGIDLGAVQASREGEAAKSQEDQQAEIRAGLDRIAAQLAANAAKEETRVQNLAATRASRVSSAAGIAQLDPQSIISAGLAAPGQIAGAFGGAQTGLLAAGGAGSLAAAAGPVGMAISALVAIGEAGGADAVAETAEAFTIALKAGIEALPAILIDVLPKFIAGLAEAVIVGFRNAIAELLSRLFGGGGDSAALSESLSSARSSSGQFGSVTSQAVPSARPTDASRMATASSRSSRSTSGSVSPNRRGRSGGAPSGAGGGGGITVVFSGDVFGANSDQLADQVAKSLQRRMGTSGTAAPTGVLG